MTVIKRLFMNDYSNTLIKKIFLIISSIINSALLNRYLGLELKGNYAYIINIVSILSLILNFGIYHSFSNFRRNNPDKVEELKQKYINLYFLQTILYFIIPIIVWIGFRRIDYLIGSIIVPLNILTGQLGMMMLIENLQYRSKIYILNSLIKLVAMVIIFVFIPKNILFAFLLLIIYDLVFIISYMAKIKKKPQLKKIDWIFTKSAIKFGFFPMLTSVLSIMNYKLDVIILKQMVPLAEIGLYSTGVALAEYAWMVPDIFKEVMFSRTAKKDSLDDVNFSLRISSVLILLIIVLVVLFGKTALFILYGSEFVPAYRVTIVIFLGIPVMMYYKIIGPLYIAKGNTKLNFYTLLISVFLNILLNIILIPIYGIIGAALASVVSYTVCGVIYQHRYRKDFNVKFRDVFIINRADIKRISKIFLNK